MNIRKQKIFLGDSQGNYELKKNEYGVPYITVGEIIESINADEVLDLETGFAKELIKDLSDKNFLWESIDVAKSAIDNLLNVSSDEAIKKIAAGLVVMLREKYE